MRIHPALNQFGSNSKFEACLEPFLYLSRSMPSSIKSKKTVGSKAPCVYAKCMAPALEIIIYALIDLLCQDRGELPIDPSGFLC